MQKFQNITDLLVINGLRDGEVIEKMHSVATNDPNRFIFGNALNVDNVKTIKTVYIMPLKQKLPQN